MSSTNGYPFLSKRAIAEKIRTDFALAVEAFKILLARTDQRAAGAQGSSGFMASHASTVRQLAGALGRGRAPRPSTGSLELLVRYVRQLAAHFRALECQARSELLAVASTFSAIPTVTTRAPEANGSDEPTAISAESPAVVDAPVPRRRGRPPGSKNKKPRSEPELPPKRRRRRS